MHSASSFLPPVSFSLLQFASPVLFSKFLTSLDHVCPCLCQPGLGLELGLEEVFVFDSKSENMDRAVEAGVSVSEARAV